MLGSHKSSGSCPTSLFQKTNSSVVRSFENTEEFHGKRNSRRRRVRSGGVPPANIVPGMITMLERCSPSEVPISKDCRQGICRVLRTSSQCATETSEMFLIVSAVARRQTDAHSQLTSDGLYSPQGAPMLSPWIKMRTGKPRERVTMVEIALGGSCRHCMSHQRDGAPRAHYS